MKYIRSTMTPPQITPNLGNFYNTRQKIQIQAKHSPTLQQPNPTTTLFHTSSLLILVISYHSNHQCRTPADLVFPAHIRRQLRNFPSLYPHSRSHLHTASQIQMLNNENDEKTRDEFSPLICRWRLHKVRILSTCWV